MSKEEVTVINELTGKPITFVFETDPNYVPLEEFQDEDGNWYFEEEEE